MPETPQLTKLSHVQTEAQLLQEILHSYSKVHTVFSPAKAEILSQLPHSQIPHFTCHGRLDPGEPLLSQLALRDWIDDPFTVADVTAMKLGAAYLAYLSACHGSGNSTPGLLDESIHLTGAFHLAVFPKVIGTLWTVSDELSAQVAVDFYKGLLNEGKLDVTFSAQALHYSVRRARETTRRVQGIARQVQDDPLIWAISVFRERKLSAKDVDIANLRRTRVFVFNSNTASASSENRV